ncbi:hypothetical protein GCM10011371_28850 [Novosphingobium marinum]|nr:hypothetical protein GCM10011371_28850 [Novosphingobium marinum]
MQPYDHSRTILRRAESHPVARGVDQHEFAPFDEPSKQRSQNREQTPAKYGMDLFGFAHFGSHLAG